MDADELSFTVGVSEETSGLRVTPRGELDVATQGALREVLARHAGAGSLVLDLGELRFLDTSGLRLILETAEAARRDGSAFAVLPGSPEIQRLFELAGVAELVPFRDRGR
jgi:anti-anti-sigma factor